MTDRIFPGAGHNSFLRRMNDRSLKEIDSYATTNSYNDPAYGTGEHTEERRPKKKEGWTPYKGQGNRRAGGKWSLGGTKKERWTEGQDLVEEVPAAQLTDVEQIQSTPVQEVHNLVGMDIVNDINSEVETINDTSSDLPPTFSSGVEDIILTEMSESCPCKKEGWLIGAAPKNVTTTCPCACTQREGFAIGGVEANTSTANTAAKSTSFSMVPKNVTTTCPCACTQREGFAIGGVSTNVSSANSAVNAATKSSLFGPAVTTTCPCACTQREGFKRKAFRVSESFASPLKDKLTGRRKFRKNKVEKFCGEHWAGVSMSILVTIVVLFLVFACLAFFKGGRPSKMTGGAARLNGPRRQT